VNALSTGVRQPSAAAMLWLICIFYPWITPFSNGPSVAVQPWLIAAVCAAFLVALRGWVAPRFPLPLWLALGCLLIAARSLPSLDALSFFGGLLLIVAMAGVTGGDSQDDFVRVMAAAWLLAALASSVFALLQYFGAADAFHPWVSHAQLGEAYGNLRQRNQLASLMAIGLAALLWFVRRDWGWGRAAVPLLLLAAASAASASRTGALQWVLLLVMALLWRGSARRRMLAVAGVGLAAYVIAAVSLPWLLSYGWGVSGSGVFARFGTSDGCAGRGVLWGNVLHLIGQHPWIGWGWGELDYAHYITLYDGPRFCDILDNGHSLPLHLAVELGVPVAVAVCGALAWALLRLSPWRETDSTRQLALSVVGVILLHSLLEYPLWYGPFQLAFGLSVGVLWPGRSQARPLDRRAAGLGVACAGLALCVLAYAAWDYHRISQIYLAPEARSPQYRVDPLPQIRQSRLFSDHVRFAELTLTPLTRANAQWTYDTALQLLHYSPEARVIEKVIESALLLGHDDVALAHLVRFRAAFPKEHAQWARERGLPAASAPPLVRD
jgi:O-antigen ligase